MIKIIDSEKDFIKNSNQLSSAAVADLVDLSDVEQSTAKDKLAPKQISVEEEFNSNELIYVDLADDNQDEEEGNLNTDIMILGSYQAPEDSLSPILRSILEYEAKMFEDLNQLYNVKGPKVFFYLDRGNGTSITLTPMCLNDANLAPRIQSKTRKSKFFYSLEWRTARSECELKQLDCIYNLIWYEPVAAFICMLGDRRRVFVCFSPLLDIKGRQTDLEFLYAMYTMCQSPNFVCFIRNKSTNKIELWSVEGRLKISIAHVIGIVVIKV